MITDEQRRVWIQLLRARASDFRAAASPVNNSSETLRVRNAARAQGLETMATAIEQGNEWLIVEAAVQGELAV